MMNSTLCLHRGALHIPSTTSRAAGLARPYSSFEPSCLSLFSKASTYPTLSRHTFCRPVTCALNKPSPPSPNYDKDNAKRIVIVVGGASVVLACILGVINYNFNFIPTAIAGPAKGRSTREVGTPLVVSRPKDVLDSLLKVNRHLATSKSTKWIGRVFKSTPQLQQLYNPQRITDYNPDNVKIAVAELIKSGKCDVAETQLKSLCEKVKGGEVGNDVEMNLVLVYIFQEKYDEALKLNCLSENRGVPSDGRFHFYKAIIHTMLGENTDAEDCWKEFVKSFSSAPLNPLEDSSEVQHRRQTRILK